MDKSTVSAVSGKGRYTQYADAPIKPTLMSISHNNNRLSTTFSLVLLRANRRIGSPKNYI
jgi:hypothetical protein